MMKTIITFDKLIADMLEQNGNDTQQVLNACQSEANKPRGTEADAKRSDFRGGQSTRADGTLVVKPIKFSEQVRSDYEIQPESGVIPWPAEFVKFHDSLVRHWKLTGRPTGALSPEMLPAHLAKPLAAKCRKLGNGKVENGQGRNRGNGVKVPAPQVPA